MTARREIPDQVRDDSVTFGMTALVRETIVEHSG